MANNHPDMLPADELTIYDMLRQIVSYIPWRNESESVRANDAINRAERNNLFGIEGKMKL